jgi:hypothetical protein
MNIHIFISIVAPNANPYIRRVLPASILYPPIVNPYSNGLPMGYYSYAKIQFSLISTTEFTAAADGGYVPPAVINDIKQIPGARFDWVRKRWTFAIKSHYALQVRSILKF